MNKFWPVPQSYSKSAQTHGDGSFGYPMMYRRKKGRHTGIDIYAPKGSRVVAVEDGIVTRVNQFTGAPESPQWNRTYYIMIENKSGKIAAYCEVKKPRIRKGEKVKAGQLIGHIAKVLKGKNTTHSCMLHFELHKKGTKKPVDWYNKKPKTVLNPTGYLNSLRK